MKSLRCEMFVNNKQGILSALQKKPLPKNKCAEMVFQFVQAGLRAGEMCAIYNISSSYYRELKVVKGGEWLGSMLTADEEFSEFINASSNAGQAEGINEADYYKLLGNIMGMYAIHGELQDMQGADILELFIGVYKSLQDPPELASTDRENAM